MLFALVGVAIFRINKVCGGFYYCELPFRDKFSDSESVGSSFLEKVRTRSAGNIRKYFPSPHSELLLGMVLGIDDLKLVPKFQENLKKTGTVHVVVVSGFNISLVFKLIITLLGSKYRLRNMLIAQTGTLFYSLLSGFEPPVIRAWIMGSIASWGIYYGRRLEVIRLLFITAISMIVIYPYFLYLLSFQLSFLATLGLVLYNDLLKKVPLFNTWSNKPLLQDLLTTVSAQVLVWPLISYRFGQVSTLSPITNTLILWTVPISTLLGGVYLLLTFILPQILLKILSFFVYVPLDFFVQVTTIFSRLKMVSFEHTATQVFLLFYYFSVVGGAIYLRGRSRWKKRF